ncbi:type III-A CRISPR-associated protein Csm2 [Macrococcoides caseolyticum]|uniref:type III-A CRISPR-associated protein Csm2 n=1 Tax=Macrococcoides caseolyticum TaxID=69966 RepID=UPI00105FA57E|nr:type III-A CRISPR-associated protein Csm2 [Macrococcus caseolyticus]TDM26800.1 type III-A CRISPR-associated protein Csm2 [Macrococcus caseolyticus]
MSTNQKIDLNFAEQIVKANKKENPSRKGTYKFFGGLTTSKLRNLMSLVNHLYIKLHSSREKSLSEDIINELEYMKVKFYYEAGRERAVKNFIEQTQLIRKIDEVIADKSKKAFIEFSRYFEALVAYAKFYGMGDK